MRMEKTLDGTHNPTLATVIPTGVSQVIFNFTHTWIFHMFYNGHI